MITIAQHRATIPSGANRVLDRRSLEKGNEHILPFLRPGIHVLDVGCGAGTISKGIAGRIESGSIIGIDMNREMVNVAKENYKHITNLSFDVKDIMTYHPEGQFDLITSARTLQWLSNPVEAIRKMMTLLKPGGIISILDYNHQKIQWAPAPPDGMRFFYKQFLAWRSDVGMNNRIADELQSIMLTLGLTVVDSVDASESCSREEDDFVEDASIWTKVAETRGNQLVEDRYITEAERLQAIDEYNDWIVNSGVSMKMYLMNVSGRLN